MLISGKLAYILKLYVFFFVLQLFCNSTVASVQYDFIKHKLNMNSPKSFVISNITVLRVMPSVAEAHKELGLRDPWHTRSGLVHWQMSPRSLAHT